MLKKVQIYAFCFLIIFVFSCGKDENPVEPETVDEFGLVTDVGDTYFTNYTTTTGGGVNLNIADLFVNLSDGNTGNDPYIIDYRSATDFATGHIKGAVNISITDLVNKIDDGTIPSDKPILNVCYTGQTASYATCVLALMGYEAQNLKFGMCGVTTDTTINGTDKWTGQIAEDEFAASLTATETTVSTEITFPVLATGHIKGAVNISITDLVNKIDDGTIPSDKPILNVCYTGQTASYATCVLALMGYEAQNLKFGMCGVTTDTTINGTDKWTGQIAEDEFAASLTATETTVSTEITFPVLATGQSEASGVIKERFKTVMGETGWGRIAAADVFSDPNKYFIINYWPQVEYINPGHIPGSYCFPPKASLGKDQMLKYLPTDKTIVVYCYTGQTSAQIAAYLQVLGYDAKSLLYGVNGFGYNSLAKSKYTAPVDDYSAIIEK